MFVRNAWYVAALDRTVDRSLRQVRMLGENVLLYRRQDGVAVALEDACPHRKLPLSMGRLLGDEVECGYHGLRFDCGGVCTRVPGAEKIPHVAQVKAYPLVERYGFLWIWMGDRALADPAKIFEVEQWGNPAWGTTLGDEMTVDCNYLYVCDNLLDPSHVAWVHQSSFGNAACEDIPVQTRSNARGNGVVVSRWMMDVEVAPFYAPFVKFAGHCDRLQHYEVRYPSHAIIKALFTPAGTGGDDKPLHPDVFLMDSYNFMTPIDEKRTRYFWFQMRNFAPGDEAVSESFSKSVRFAFEEDRVVLNAVQIGMDTKTSPNLDLKIDAGPLRFRKHIRELVEAERPLAQAAE
ncbi:aromatic ring-hydroxylating dioxygenase subunit alpha [Methylobrevis pamukkalensis]|uniref:Toluene-4-sulfonate monooxygenase system iron-sulfur subunit TsaM1 n=1 Tax=Methylobrevis pamukkalensis TaxID=1439726 RepID=A0A1E3H9D1_9HYPH|nr:aromatic ring-hydroxylating dioxygenase subunit alpha [Methylobrevis pamukkalensis]ODN72396.1 Toluene-4-sulfonate monooxygenase system iron-sulfur subunit TsaM1 [Methylobrevis pamukkalensis]